MQQFTDQRHSMSGSDTGNFGVATSRLDEWPEWQALILLQISFELSAEVEYQNHLTYSETAPVEEIDMRDVKQAAANIRDFVARIKEQTAQAQKGFLAEGNHALANADKLMSAAQDLKDANQMMEEALGDTGSNFPPSDVQSSGSLKPHPDINGVTLNPEAKK
jgi:hypothetical protein